jgi:hypothetical protein
MCEGRILTAGWRALGDRLIRRLWLLQSEMLCDQANAINSE